MLTIGRLSGGGRAADYYLDRGAECEEPAQPKAGRSPSEYYTGDPDAGGRWVGHGAAALGLRGPLGPEGAGGLRSLLDGTGLDGAALVKPVWRSDQRGSVPARALVVAVTAAAQLRGVEPSDLFDEPADRGAFERALAAASLDRRMARRPRAALLAETAGRLCAAAGLDPVSVFRGDAGEDRFGAAMRFAGERVDVRRAGLDLTFSAPKSASVLFALADPEVAATVRAAHAVAVDQTVAYLEQLAATGMRGHNADGHPPRIRTDGWVAAAFDHVSSRADDPQLHTHVVVPNLVRGEDGRWSAFDTRTAYRYAQTGGFVYQAVLRAELSQRLGVRWSAVRRGVAEIDGVPVGLCRLFSRRRAEVVELLAESGRSGLHASHIAALRSRSPKSGRGEASLRTEWQCRAMDAGFDVDRVLASCVSTEPVRRPSPSARVLAAVIAQRIADDVLGPHGVTENASSFDRRDLLRFVCERVPPGLPVSVEVLRAVATRLIRDPRVVPMTLVGPAAERRYTTSELLVTEHTSLVAAAARTSAGVGRASAEVLDDALAGARTLTAEQAACVRQLTSSGAGVEVVVGPAGAGKTAALATAHAVWQRAGVTVRGAAVAALAARNLEDGAGIESMSLTRLFGAIERDGLTTTLPAGGVLVVDEASMVSTRTLAQLVRLTERARTKLVLVGDPAQLPEIGAGGLFAALAQDLPAAELAGNVRQRSAWERAALAELRDGDPYASLTAYSEHQRVHLADSTQDAREQIVTHYLDELDNSPDVDAVMLTGTRADARALNQLTRERLRERGALTGDGIRVHTRGRDAEYLVGDRVIVTVNDYRRELFNGTRGTVIAADERGLTLRLAANAEGTTREVSVSRASVAAGVVEHGYALTCHRAQGVTVDVALLYASRTLSREAGYVAMSRGRFANHVFATWDALAPEVDHGLDGPHEPPVARRERDELTGAALVQRLESRRAQRLASDQLEQSRQAMGRAIAPRDGVVAR